MASAKKRGKSTSKNTPKYVFPSFILIFAILLVSVLYVLVPPLFGKVTEGVNYRGPIAYYNFESRSALGNDVAGTYDASCDARLGQTCPNYITVNKDEGAADFSGKDNRQLVLGSSISLPSEFTIMFEVHQSSGGTIVWGSNGGIIINPSNGRVQFSLLGSGLATSTPAPNGQWVHYALVRNNNDIVRFYKDGVLESGTYDIDGSLRVDTLGYSREQGSLQGFLDNLKIFNYALTEWQIRISGGLPAIENTVSLCRDTIDNDNDGRVDCADENCHGIVVGSNEERCEFPEERSCMDGFDNNGDGRADENCAILTEICADTIDNDNDGLVDEGCGVMVESAETCNDRIDNNDNGFIDENCPAQCALNSLPSCSSEAQCTSTGGVWYAPDSGETGEEPFSICVECTNNGDCAETETCRDYGCVSTGEAAMEICGDSLDNDNDGQVDEGCAAPSQPSPGGQPTAGSTDAGTTSSGTRTAERTGRQTCVSDWNCGLWTACNRTSQQSRTCTDTNQCNPAQRTKREVKSCTFCEESWVCQEWSSCQEGRQKRICVDERTCGSTVEKPATEQECIMPEVGETEPGTPEVQQAWAWEKYAVGGAGLLAVLAIITLLLRRKKKK